MATKKEKKAKQIRAKKIKQKKRIGIIGAIAAVCVGFLIFFFITLFDSLYPPTADRTTRTATQEREQFTLYFADTNERFLVPESRYISKHGNKAEQAEELVRALIEGSNLGGMRTIPAEAYLISVSVRNEDTAVVNFRRNLVDLHPGGSASEIMTVYSITNTILTNIPSLSQVFFQIDGRPIRTLKGHIDTEMPFVLNNELIIKERG